MPEPIAIVGMAAVFPGAADLDAYWSNIEAGVDAITDVPAQRLDPAFRDAFACKRGGFVAPTFDPIAFGIMPIAAAGAEPDQLLSLHVAAAALADAGGTIARDRAGVILGRGAYLTAGMARLANRVRMSQQLVTTLHELLPDLDAETVDKIRAAFRSGAGEVGPEAAIGLVPNLAASRIANRLDLRGPAYTIDAACASSLIAIDQGCRELADRRCDVVVAGGVHVCHDVTFWSVFSELGALSKSSAIRPFDRRADGIVLGEGAGVVVLKRLADAERAGDRIYAVILGTGVSSDGRESSAMRPRADGQLAAISAAWRAAERDPASVGLVEAHGTATQAGDEVELAALAQFFGETSGPRAALGSVKSMIGHAMPAAGAAGLIKTALAIHHGVLPPSLHCEEPHDGLATTRFRVPAAAEPWGLHPRLAGVSAFGFGGINAHVVLEAHAASGVPRAAHLPRDTSGRVEAAYDSHSSVSGSANAPAARPNRAAAVDRPRVLAIAAGTIAELHAALDAADAPARGSGLRLTLAAAPAGRGAVLDATDPQARAAGPLRLAMLDPTPERRALAHKVLDRGTAWRGNKDIWFAPRGLAADGGKLAFVFPGIEATFAANLDELGDASPVIAAAIGSPELEARGRAVFALGRHLAAAVARLGAVPDAIAGHSMGEWTGMVASEMIPPGAVAAFLDELPASLEVPDVVFAAVGCSADGARTALDGLDAISVSHDNCPHQSIVCGRNDRVRTAIERLGQRGVLCQELPFRSGFHSPLFADYLAPHRARIATLALQRPRVPLWSATTCAPYPDDPAAIRALAIDHLVQPVRFRELVEQLYASGVRAFIQLGVGSVAGFVDDTLRGRDHLAIAGASPHAGQLARLSAALWVDGFTSEIEPRARPATAPRGMPLDLGVPLVRLGDRIAPLSLGDQRPSAGDDPVLAELLATLDEAAAASRAVVDAYRAKTRPQHAVVRRSLSVETVPALIDHCFYRQPASWPTVADRYPVVPMTMMIEMMIDTARRLAPEKVAIAVEDVRALRWLAVAPTVDVEITARGGDRIDVEIPGYARATVVLADRYPTAPAPAQPPLVAPRPAPLDARRMYDDRWMFHGPQYQGVTELGPIGDNGVDGVIDVLPAPGALLDCAGQLMGWWVMHTETRDRLAMPVKIDRIALFAPDPVAGERVACRVRMRRVLEREVRADLELVAGGRVWARIDGWEDRRFDSDDAVWAVLMYPETNALAVPTGAFVTVTEHWRGAASRELMMRRYLGERERVAHDELGPRGRRGWLLGRIAIKDAVRQYRWNRGAGPIFPVEVEVRNEASGRPVVDGGVHVSVAHKDDLAVAIAAEHEVGIDIERIEPRTEAFAAIAYTAAERALGDGGEEWLTRLWAAKEAAAKALGTGITDPKRFEVVARAGDRLRIGAREIETRRDGDYIIAWTSP